MRAGYTKITYRLFYRGGVPVRRSHPFSIRDEEVRCYYTRAGRKGKRGDQNRRSSSGRRREQPTWCHVSSGSAKDRPRAGS